ncbi:SRPBCC family protein [Calothrix sp. UHCC 0171]|uniref:SRPBCC family protein n=1 Tax=Calothrix sp. UHCC 0171 TaxID=3110245 RepID=UPI002B21ADEC|nr:SRPBCC family protein [Calothrix sp. UHCC 0171]MEA5574210.1 SRPBCC family protein [Calothrix sp. UHCC 0171]
MTEQSNPAAEFPISAPHDTNTDSDFASDAPELEAVEVEIAKIAERQRRITARIKILRSPEIVWKVLTDYEALADFIPNLAKSSLLEHPTGGIRLEQIGSQRLLNFNFCARVVLDLEEKFPQEITFQMVEGDLKEFSGSWQLQPCSVDNQSGTSLCYSIFVHPKRIMPIGVIERRLSSDLRVNMFAIQQRVETLH